MLFVPQTVQCLSPQGFQQCLTCSGRIPKCQFPFQDLTKECLLVLWAAAGFQSHPACCHCVHTQVCCDPAVLSECWAGGRGSAGAGGSRRSLLQCGSGAQRPRTPHPRDSRQAGSSSHAFNVSLQLHGALMVPRGDSGWGQQSVPAVGAPGPGFSAEVLPEWLWVPRR